MQQISNNFGNEIILLSEEEYQDLLDDATWRVAYENAGVDNWDGADFANELYREYTSEGN